MDKILFLDIDGVLIPQRAFCLPGQTMIWSKFDPVAVALLNHLQKSIPDLRTVIHSSWTKTNFWKRIGEGEWTDDHILPDYMKSQGLNLLYHEDWTTPKKFSSRRWSEINFWLEDHPDVTSFVIIDDEIVPEGHNLSPHVIQTDFEDGFLLRHLKEVLTYFNAKEAKADFK